MTRKVLVSPGYGAGWSSWIGGGDQGKFAAEYAPLIEFIEGGGQIVEKPYDGGRDIHKPWEEFEEPGASVIRRFVEDYWSKFGDDDTPYLGGADQLVVYTVEGPYRIDEYDGSERLVAASDEVWW